MNFNPYTDDWESPARRHGHTTILRPRRPIRWGRQISWYQASRTPERSMWRQANVAKVGLHFESILIRGLMNYTSPPVTGMVAACTNRSKSNHTMMFQEMVNRVGATRAATAAAVGFTAARWRPTIAWWPSSSAFRWRAHHAKNVARRQSLHPIMERVHSRAEEVAHSARPRAKRAAAPDLDAVRSRSTP